MEFESNKCEKNNAENASSIDGISDIVKQSVKECMVIRVRLTSDNQIQMKRWDYPAPEENLVEPITNQTSNVINMIK
jgi:hypothetical protein